MPKILTTGSVSRADIVVTMSCGDTRSYFPGKRYEDWDLTDPTGQPPDVVRQVRANSGSASPPWSTTC